MITFKGAKVGFYMTSRACKPDGTLRTLDFLPEFFHQHITVVTGEEYAEKVRAKYPTLQGVWVTGPEINSAASKRKLIMSTYKENLAVLINDDVTIHVYNEDTKRYVHPRNGEDGEHWFKHHLKAFLRLSETHYGASLHDRAFSKQFLDGNPGNYIRKNCFIGAFFFIKKSVARNKMQLGRLNYYEDIDYSLQLLSQGFTTAQYVGMVFSHPSTKPTRQHSDRTASVQDRDREKLISYFPHAVRKRPPEKLREDLNIDIYVSYSTAWKAYHAEKNKPKRGLF